MQNYVCCQAGAVSSANKKLSFLKRCIGIVKMMIPTFLLALIPKCPVCLAGYIGLFTGLGVSVTTAAHLRFFLIIACIGSILYFVSKKLQLFPKK